MIRSTIAAIATHVLLAVAILVGAACSGGGGGPAVEEGRPSTTPASPGFIGTVVTLDDQGRSAAGIEIVDVGRVATLYLDATGAVGFDQNRVALIGPSTEGRVVRIVRDLGNRVKSGDLLAVVESAALGEAQADYGRAAAQIELAQRNYEREQGLLAQHVSSEREAFEARASYEVAKVELASAAARVRALGGDPGATSAEVSIISPIAGNVVEREAVAGQVVGPDTRLFTVADLGRVWLNIDIYDKDLGRVRVGQAVEVRSDAFPDDVFHGKLDHIGQVVDTATRTLKARVEIENNRERLRPGMFVRASIAIPLSSGIPVVPAGAIQEIDGRSVVFVPRGADGFEVRAVAAGEATRDGRVVVHSGVDVGDRIVAAGSFALKSELLKGSFADTD